MADFKSELHEKKDARVGEAAFVRPRFRKMGDGIQDRYDVRRLAGRAFKAARELGSRGETSGSAQRDVFLAGLGAKAKAQEEGDDFFGELVKAGRELEALERDLSDLHSQEESLIEPSLAAEDREILAYADVLDRLLREHRTFERMVELMLPETLPTAPMVLQARRNAVAREALISDFGLLNSAEIAALAGSRAKNKASLANRWKQEGRIFSVPYRGSAYFPGYQFDDKGLPLSLIPRILATLGRQSREWELALWFTSANGWLDGRRPVDILRSEPEEVAEAAAREAEGLFF